MDQSKNQRQNMIQSTEQSNVHSIHPNSSNTKTIYIQNKEPHKKQNSDLKQPENITQQLKECDLAPQQGCVIELILSDSIKTNKKKLVTPKNQHEDRYSDDDMVTSEEPKGLPNIGNNCFLNSAIQLLFTAEKFRKMLIKKYHRNAKNMSKNENSCSPSFLLGALFFHLEKKGDFVNEKRILLKNFLVCLSRLNLQYEMYRQEDAFETLNNLLCNLDYSEEEREEIRGLFEVVTEMQCQCMSEPMRIASMYAKTDPQTCETCRQLFKTKTVSFPIYLLVSQSTNIGKSLDRQGQYYDLSCNMRYYGNGKSGHYNVKTFTDSKSYIINDSQVIPLTEYEGSRQIECCQGWYGCCCFSCISWLFCYSVEAMVEYDRNALFSLFIKNPNSKNLYPKSSQSWQQQKCSSKWKGCMKGCLHQCLNICYYCPLEQNQTISSMSICNWNILFQCAVMENQKQRVQ